jgi:uncharacterized protein YndB with AHSA1/START domain
VYGAFVNPAITNKFWFSKSSGRLEIRRFIRWDWEMFEVSTMVDVNELNPGKRILVEWDVKKIPAYVESIFTPRTPNTTFVSIANSGFCRDGDRVFERAMGSVGGLGSSWQE